MRTNPNKRSIIVLLMMFVFPLFAEVTTFAVLDFENNSFVNREEYGPLSQGLAEMLITELSQVSTVQVVERQKLRSILDEMKLSQSGMISEDHTLQAGRMLGAKYLVFGAFMVDLDKKIRIDIRIIEVETGLTIEAGQVTGKTKKVLSLVKKLSKKTLKDLKIALTKNEKKALEKSEGVELKAIIQFSKGVESEDAEDWTQAAQYYKEALKISPTFKQAQKRLEKLKEKETEKDT